MNNPTLIKEIQNLFSQFQYFQVFVDMGVKGFNIMGIITFLHFVKIFILKLKTFLKVQLLLSWHPVRLSKNDGNIQLFFWKWMEIKFSCNWYINEQVWEASSSK